VALNKAKLTAALVKLMDPTAAGFAGYPADVATAAANFADAYNTYAIDAVDVSGDMLAVANKAGFQSALAAGLAASQSGAQAAQAFASAWALFWLSATFQVGVPPTPAARCPSVGGTGIWSVEATSIVTAAVPAPLQSALALEFATISDTPAVKAAALADAFHTATLSVVVTVSGLDASPIPTAIVNVCTIM
jgi:hypothetical protein